MSSVDSWSGNQCNNYVVAFLQGLNTNASPQLFLLLQQWKDLKPRQFGFRCCYSTFSSSFSLSEYQSLSQSVPSFGLLLVYFINNKTARGGGTGGAGFTLGELKRLRWIPPPNRRQPPSAWQSRCACSLAARSLRLFGKWLNSFGSNSSHGRFA